MTISFEKDSLELFHLFLSSCKQIFSGNSVVTFGALIVNPNFRKYLVRKAFRYAKTGVLTIVSGYLVFVLIYFSEEISASHT
jgi:hypothetical protein